MGDNIIRQLGLIESLYDDEVINGSFVLSRAFHVQISKSHLIENEMVHRALLFWKKRHPLLQSRILRANGNINKYSTIRDIKYFAYIDNDRVSKNDNFEYLETCDEHTWKSVLEKEVTEPFDIENGPLWRMKLLKMPVSTNEDDDINKYVFILCTHHSIGDGRGLTALMVELFEILGTIIKGGVPSRHVEETSASLEFLTDNYMKTITGTARLEDHLHCTFNNKTENIRKINWPETFGNINQPIETTCFDYIDIVTEKLAKLVAKTKQYTRNGKVSGLLVTIISACFQKLFRKYNEINENANIIEYILPVSLREKLNLSASQMGVYSTVLACHLDCNKLGDIWQCIDEQSSLHHKRIRNNEHFHNVDISQMIDAFEQNGHFNSQSHLFVFSNVGTIKYSNQEQPIKLKAHYVFESVREARVAGCFFIGVSTICDTLNIGFSFNERRFSRSFIEEFKQTISDYVDKLIDD